jgi:inorganic pyrophosphatase
MRSHDLAASLHETTTNPMPRSRRRAGAAIQKKVSGTKIGHFVPDTFFFLLSASDLFWELLGIAFALLRQLPQTHGTMNGDVRMVTPIHDLPPIDPNSGYLNVVVDTPKGSRNKYKLDENQGVWRLSKVLPQGMSFPYDFGFLPGTRGEDGDPLDVLLLMDEPAFAGCVVPARLIGVLEARQTEGGKTVRNDRLLAVVETPYNRAEYRSLEEVSEQRLAEIEHFFIAYNHAEGREFKPVARRGADHAAKVLGEAIEGGGHSRNGPKRARGPGKT